MKPATLLSVAHWAMGITFSCSILILYLIYGRDLGFSIRTLVFLHILFVLLAVIFKISYVVRLTALKQMGRAAH
jgi:hypothetical protein